MAPEGVKEKVGAQVNGRRYSYPETLALLVAVVVLGSCTDPEPRPSAGGIRGSPEARSVGKCGVIDVGSEEYGAHVEPVRGKPREDIALFGSTFRDEGGRWTPSSKIEFWFSSKRQLGVPGSGDSKLLATVEPGTACRFRTTALVPDVVPGSYWISSLVYHRDGFGYFLRQRFTVLA